MDRTLGVIIPDSLYLGHLVKSLSPRKPYGKLREQTNALYRRLSTRYLQDEFERFIGFICSTAKEASDFTFLDAWVGFVLIQHVTGKGILEEDLNMEIQKYTDFGILSIIGLVTGEQIWKHVNAKGNRRRLNPLLNGFKWDRERNFFYDPYVITRQGLPLAFQHPTIANGRALQFQLVNENTCTS